jgi:hypothetical protein
MVDEMKRAFASRRCVIVHFASGTSDAPGATQEGTMNKQEFQELDLDQLSTVAGGSRGREYGRACAAGALRGAVAGLFRGGPIGVIAGGVLGCLGNMAARAIERR